MVLRAEAEGEHVGEGTGGFDDVAVGVVGVLRGDAAGLRDVEASRPSTPPAPCSVPDLSMPQKYSKVLVVPSAKSTFSSTSPPCGFRSGISFVTALTFLCFGLVGKGNEAVVVCNRAIHLGGCIRKDFGDMRSGDEKFVAVLFACTFQSHAHSE